MSSEPKPYLEIYDWRGMPDNVINICGPTIRLPKFVDPWPLEEIKAYDVERKKMASAFNRIQEREKLRLAYVEAAAACLGVVVQSDRLNNRSIKEHHWRVGSPSGASTIQFGFERHTQVADFPVIKFAPYILVRGEGDLAYCKATQTPDVQIWRRPIESLFVVSDFFQELGTFDYKKPDICSMDELAEVVREVTRHVLSFIGGEVRADEGMHVQFKATQGALLSLNEEGRSVPLSPRSTFGHWDPASPRP